MKFATFSHGGKASYGAVVGDGIVDLGKKLGSKYPDLRSLLAGDGLAAAKAALAGASPDVKTADVTWLPVLSKPDKIFCVALTKNPNTEKPGRKDEEQPVIFARYASSQTGHLQPMICPKESDK